MRTLEQVMARGAPQSKRYRHDAHVLAGASQRFTIMLLYRLAIGTMVLIKPLPDQLTRDIQGHD